MTIPPGHTEETVLAAIERVVTILAPQFVFGYFDLEDLQQYGRIYAIEFLNSGKYNPELPLENIVYSHVRFQFINLKRNKYRRCDPPCKKCHKGEFCGELGQPCKNYAKWFDRNQAKANLLRPLDIQNISDEKESLTRMESVVESSVIRNELAELIDTHLSVELRPDYLRLLYDETLPKVRRERVQSAVREIFEKAGLDCEGLGVPTAAKPSARNGNQKLAA
jgi:hypothetical protein